MTLTKMTKYIYILFFCSDKKKLLKMWDVLVCVLLELMLTSYCFSNTIHNYSLK